MYGGGKELKYIIFLALLIPISIITGASQPELKSSDGIQWLPIEEGAQKYKNWATFTRDISSLKDVTVTLKNNFEKNLKFAWRMDNIDKYDRIAANFYINDGEPQCSCKVKEYKEEGPYVVKPGDEIKFTIKNMAPNKTQVWIAFPLAVDDSNHTINNFKNNSWSPACGSILYPYSFSVEIANCSENPEVELDTKDASSIDWQCQGIQTYKDYNKTLNWTDIKFNSSGGKEYRLIYNRIIMDYNNGPKISKLNTNITPEGGAFDENYTYNIKLDKEEISYLKQINYLPSDLILNINNPYNNEKVFEAKGNWSNEGISFSVSKLGDTIDDDYLGVLKYSIRTNTQLFGDFDGPNIYIAYQPVRDDNGNSNEIKIKVKSTRCNIPLYLRLYPEGCSNVLNNPQIYNKCRSPDPWQILSWNVQDKSKCKKILCDSND